MFSPYYARARRRGTPDPLNHSALNVALYGDGGQRWAMTERGRDAVHRSVDAMALGPSALSWDGTTLTVRIDELAVPLPRRIRGTVLLHATALFGESFALDAAGRHHWDPIAPNARIEVHLQRPALRWTGSGYFDANAGEVPLEASFTRWDWCRAELGRGTGVLYDVTRSQGDGHSLALRFDPSGGIEALTPPAPVPLSPTLWGIARNVRSDAPPRVVRGLEDAPFYARSQVALRLLGESVDAVHESLSLDRFRAPWVQMLLPFRMPRALR